jgi:hypothetical protein
MAKLICKNCNTNYQIKFDRALVGRRQSLAR